MLADVFSVHRVLAIYGHAAYVNHTAYESRYIIISVSQMRKFRHRDVTEFAQDSQFIKGSNRSSLVLQIGDLNGDIVLPLL